VKTKLCALLSYCSVYGFTPSHTDLEFSEIKTTSRHDASSLMRLDAYMPE
jgi:hypothetical protein